MLVGFARNLKSLSARAGFHACLSSLLLIAAAGTVHDATALGDNRTLSFHHTHSGEDLTVTFKRNGRYDEDALKQINHFLRDWRSQDSTTMDRRLFDILWEVYRDVDGKQPIQIISAYRSPATNAMLRRRSSGVARASQHMLGHAMDFFIPAVPLEQIRFAGLRLQRGGVGFYPTSGSPFVHLDTGSIRHWPRMTHDQLARVFPDGRTVHVPSDGNPLPGYQLAMADIEKRGDGDSAALAKSKPGLFTSLFRGKSNDDDEEGAAPAAPAKPSTIGLMAAAMPAKSAEPVPMPRAKPARAASFQVASADIVPPAPRMASDGNPAPRPPAGLAGDTATKPQTPADIINARGFWDQMPAAPKQASPAQVAAISARQALANAAEPQSAAASAFQQALAYAPPSAPLDRSQIVAASAPIPRSARPASPARNPMAVTSITTVLAKGSHGQISAISTSARLSAAPGRDESVWTRMMILAPSAITSMSTTVMGDGDLTVLRAHFVKPQAAVTMSFADDPQLGLVCDRFTGTAITTLATTPFTRTAELR
ncbi:DUF882 domain-containing protein [Rhodopseudomonas sp. P2A-2r]|uniref:DUF882 domain-containing protein n=1 Tax=Rhodopseudomonas sp. P2A-2r TaxID=2991972 RepID=UPI0039B6F5F8